MTGLLKSLRLEKGWSQEQLAGIADISERTVQRLERGDACSLETAKALATAFDTRAETFIERTGGPAEPKADEERLREVQLERKARQNFKLYKNFAVYLAVNTMLVVINLVTYPEHLWFIYPLLGWGLILAFNAILVFRPDWEKRIVRRMVEKERDGTV